MQSVTRVCLFSVLRRFSAVSYSPQTSGGLQPELRTHAVERIFDGELSSQREINRVRIEELVCEFQRQSGDTGSTPVQIAVLTFRIKHLNKHMKNNRKDYSCQRSLVKMVHQRRKLMQYLERTDHLSYQAILLKLQLRPPKTQMPSRK